MDSTKYIDDLGFGFPLDDKNVQNGPPKLRTARTRFGLVLESVGLVSSS